MAIGLDSRQKLEISPQQFPRVMGTLVGGGMYLTEPSIKWHLDVYHMQLQVV